MKNTNMQKVRLHIKRIGSPQCDLTPGYTVVSECTDMVCVEWEWAHPAIMGVFEVTLHSKTPSDTVVATDGSIISDVALQITKIEFNDVDVTTDVDKFGVYLTEAHGRQTTYGYMGFNGRYRLKFRYSPYYMKSLCHLKDSKKIVTGG